MVAIILGILAGVSIVVSRMTNAGLAERIGLYQSSFYNYITGLVAALLLVLAVRAPFPGLPVPGSVWELLAYTGGLLGLATVMISNMVATRIPAMLFTLLVFTSQLFTGLLLDYLLYRVFSPGRLVGGICLLAGLLLYQEPARHDKSGESGCS